MNDAPPRIAVLGAGSWGTALAMQLARAGCRVALWGRDEQRIIQMREERVNPAYLSEFELPEQIEPEPSLELAVTASEHVLLACPSHGFQALLKSAKQFLGEQSGVVWASKGFDPGTGYLLHQVAEDLLGKERMLALITGPSFAREVALDLPTAVTVASNNEAFGQCVARTFHAGNFRAYTTDDMIGAELGGAVKNVMAVATGICDGMQLGDNARAALITRGMAEMMRLGRLMGARPETMMGLAGMGDLVLTCTGDQSRNRRLGLALGTGQSVAAALEEIGQVVEGVKTSEEVMRLAGKLQVETPITEQVFGIIHKGWNPQTAVRVLLSREQKAEHH